MELVNLQPELHEKFAPLQGLKSARQLNKKIKQRQEIDRVLLAYAYASTRGMPLGTKEQAIKSVAAVILPVLFRWLLSTLATKVIEYIWERLNNDRPGSQKCGNGEACSGCNRC